MFLFLFTFAHDYKLCRIGDKFLHISKNYPLIKNITPSQYEQRIVGGLKYTKNDKRKKHSNSFTQLGTNSLIEVKTRPELKPRRTALIHKVFSFSYFKNNHRRPSPGKNQRPKICSFIISSFIISQPASRGSTAMVVTRLEPSGFPRSGFPHTRLGHRTCKTRHF